MSTIGAVGLSVLLCGNSVGAQPSGEALFGQHCAVCHADGGNIMNPRKTLHQKDLQANKLKTPSDILRTVRNPGPGMTKFDAKAISDQDAMAIGEHIIKTFK